MESNKNVSNEQSKASGGGQGSTGSTGSSGRGSSGSAGAGGSGAQNRQTASAPQRAQESSDIGSSTNDIANRGSEMYDQTRQVMSSAYDKTTETLSGTYEQAMSYGREHPGKLTMIAFGAGIAIGMLLSATSRPSRTERIAEPVVNALSRVALEFLR